MDTPWSTIPELIDDAAARFGDAEGLVDGDVRWSFAELADQIHQSARAAMASGVEPGDVVAVWAPNVGEWIVAALGVHCAGGVLLPINTRWKGHEAGFVLAKTGAKLLFTVTDFLDTDYLDLLTDADQRDLVDEVVVLRGDVPADATSFADYIDRAEQTDPAAETARAAAVQGDDLCHIMFTSGTTGQPKGAMLEHAAVCKGYNAWATVVGLTAGDRYLIINPFFHSFGMNAGILACLMKGATIIPHAVFDVPQVMQRVPEESISMLPGPPAIYQTILNHPDLDSFDMTSLRLAVTGAAPVPVEMLAQMRARLGFETIITGYGLTESTGIATMCRHDDPPEIISGTSGRAIPDVEVRIVDPDGIEVPRGDQGEIVIRGYNVMRGYLDDPEKTAATIDGDGWLHSGDLGVMDENGYVDITGRTKDMYICGGFNCYPAEIENLMLAHPKIGQVAVVGAPDQRMGEVGFAFIIPSPGADDIDTAEVLGWCRDQMANYKVPRHAEIVEEFPLNATGKVQKTDLEAIAAAKLSS
ncbi:MAG: AMP-binding protein [Acidimicrobiales bacterium]|nr:AMP-binding protein [Acidimicrobiales bacterium]